MDAAQFKEDIFSLKDLLYRIALRLLVEAADAEDAVQQTMMQMWQKRADLPRMEHLRAFVIKSLRNDCLNRITKKQTQEKHHLQISRTQAMHCEFENNNMSSIILEEINKLPEKQKLIIQLCDVEGFGKNEVAEIIGMEESAVRANLSRARQKLRVEIEKLRLYEQRQL